MVTPFLEVKDLDKWYLTSEHRVEVLKGLNLQVFRKDALAVVGSSGVGKSTLLHILGALDRPTRGEVLFEGQNIFGLEPREMARFRNRKIGFVFQFHHLLPEFNALENTMMPVLIAREQREEARARAQRLLTQVGLEARMTHRIGELSGGEQQRVAIARALVQDPELVLADEPTGNLDRKTGEQVLDLFMELNQQKGITFVMVTHNLELASQFNRKIEIRDGQAVELNHF
ncbi:MAG: ABC transporter ATP-binding protein [Deltaproteobacteria bacterium]|nr:ABC transporter ATP-binding protein [Deltaproteobacteria bacterium]